MHAHRQAVSAKVPGSFLSNNQWAAKKRGGPRPRKRDREATQGVTRATRAGVQMIVSPDETPTWSNGTASWQSFATGGWSGAEWRTGDPAPSTANEDDSNVGFDPEQLLSGKLPEIRDTRILVLSELDHILVWREYDTNRLFIRPQAQRLVSALLQEPRCSFAVISCMAHWRCLPAMRALLNSVVRGDWVVEGSIQGRWNSDSRGGRADTTSPPSIVRRSLNGTEQQRVYVFDRDRAVADVPVAGRWFVKELSRVWSALGECGCGSFTEHNTVQLDVRAAGVSHPKNVIRIPRWKDMRMVMACVP